MSDFGSAFRQARASGKAVFEWQGKKYHTKTKEEMEAMTRSPAPSASAPAAPAPAPRYEAPNSEENAPVSRSGGDASNESFAKRMGRGVRSLGIGALSRLSQSEARGYNK